ncbi:tyrosyl-DNA phosphodiesterase domain-containing protein [Ampelomyces quisqualis]|uniref:Tyrosyl-DNA phosphodiesterase domain-containing protein n=1 Tax=Ampelomyces quisqualis TaxID=50730 RepID=A0A6A5QSA3_AMPQU|nr:tyrosyl-DNA phosphodiesterase domain-containing protein [Ampelomyces quisqualis]
MASSDEDEDLKLALALSLHDSPPKQPKRVKTDPKAIDLTSDTEDEDEDMRRAMALSLGALKQSASPQQPLTAKLSSAVTCSSPITTGTIPASSTLHTSSSTGQSRASGISGIDRKAMELERLARLGKRKREPPPSLPSKQTASDARVNPDVQAPSIMSTLEYPRGAIKRTAATNFPRTDDITIDEVLQAESLNIAVISSFMWDSQWLVKKLSPRKVKQIWVMNAKGEDVQQRWVREMEEAGVPNLKMHFPPMDGLIHSMHSKLMLLFGKDKLRVVVPSANMIPFDWGEVPNDWQPGVMENSVFLVDLPRRNDRAVGDKKDLTAFGKELVHFLERQEIGTNVADGVRKFDFAQTGHLAFVHAIGGSHPGESQNPTGLAGLAKAIRDLELDDVKVIEIDYASASLGAINDQFLQRMYLAARGEPFTAASTVSNVRDHFRVYFPTDKAVEKSIGGRDCGGTISLCKKYYDAPTFPRECLRNYDSTRRGMLSHNKLLFARGIKNNGKPFAWVYTGSANMSESAWGMQKVLKKTGQVGSLSIRNWECGVVVPVPKQKILSLDSSDGKIPPMSVFDGTIEVPFVHPGEAYGDEQPWLFMSG